MTVMIATGRLLDAANGNKIGEAKKGSKVTVTPGSQTGNWVEVTLISVPGQPKGWVSVDLVDQTTDTVAALSAKELAAACHNVGLGAGVSGHYLGAVATLRTGVVDVQSGPAIGPFAFTAGEWALAITQVDPMLGMTVQDRTAWDMQVPVFAAMMKKAQVALAAKLARQPTALQLYFSQLIGTDGAVAALAKPDSALANFLPDAGAAAAAGIDPANLTGRDAALLGKGTVADALKALTAALDTAIATSKPFAQATGDKPISTGAAVPAKP